LFGGNGDLEIRVANHSNVPIEEVRIGFPSQTEEYGTIPPQGVTEYRVVKKAYRYAQLVAKIGGEEVVIQPFDYFREKPLKSGKYTYVLTVNKNATTKFNRIKLRLRKE
jgi:hypothetical protein